MIKKIMLLSTLGSLACSYSMDSRPRVMTLSDLKREDLTTSTAVKQLQSDFATLRREVKGKEEETVEILKTIYFNLTGNETEEDIVAVVLMGKITRAISSLQNELQKKESEDMLRTTQRPQSSATASSRTPETVAQMATQLGTRLEELTKEHTTLTKDHQTLIEKQEELQRQYARAQRNIAQLNTEIMELMDQLDKDAGVSQEIQTKQRVEIARLLECKKELEREITELRSIFREIADANQE